MYKHTNASFRRALRLDVGAGGRVAQLGLGGRVAQLGSGLVRVAAACVPHFRQDRKGAGDRAVGSGRRERFCGPGAIGVASSMSRPSSALPAACPVALPSLSSAAAAPASTKQARCGGSAGAPLSSGPLARPLVSAWGSSSSPPSSPAAPSLCSLAAPRLAAR